MKVPTFCDRCARSEFEGYAYGKWVSRLVSRDADGVMTCTACRLERSAPKEAPPAPKPSWDWLTAISR